MGSRQGRPVKVSDEYLGVVYMTLPDVLRNNIRALAGDGNFNKFVIEICLSLRAHRFVRS